MPPERRDPRSGKPTYIAGAEAIVRDEAGRVLWIRRSDTGRWELPGGVIEFGETPGDAAVREAFGQTGFIVEVIRLAAIDWQRTVADAVFVFECRIAGGTATPSAESSAVVCIDMAEPASAPPHIVERVGRVISSPHEVLLLSTS